MAGGSPEHREGEKSLGMFREVAEEGEEPIVSEKLYLAVVQVVLLFWAETWFLTAMKLQKLEGVNVGFLRQVAEMTARKLGVDTWQKGGGVEGAPGNRYKVSSGIHREEAGDGSGVGIPTTNIRDFCKRDTERNVLRRWIPSII